LLAEDSFEGKADDRPIPEERQNFNTEGHGVGLSQAYSQGATEEIIQIIYLNKIA
jgi:hypothetical protein